MLNMLNVKPNFYQADSSITSGIESFKKKDKVLDHGETDKPVHAFHKICLENWYSQKKSLDKSRVSCPTCRENLEVGALFPWEKIKEIAKSIFIPSLGDMVGGMVGAGFANLIILPTILLDSNKNLIDDACFISSGLLLMTLVVASIIVMGDMGPVGHNFLLRGFVGGLAGPMIAKMLAGSVQTFIGLSVLMGFLVPHRLFRNRH